SVIRRRRRPAKRGDAADMPNVGGAHLTLRAISAFLAAGALFLGANSAVGAQTPQGATLTVSSGQVGVVKANGARISPARSGSDLGVGDQVGTIGDSNALVTFFEGTELELGKDTTIILREIQSSGNEVHITIVDVLGVTNSRLKAFVNPNSMYQ